LEAVLWVQKTGLFRNSGVKEVCCIQEATTVSISGPEIGLKTGKFRPASGGAFHKLKSGKM
jgi:hypothetical protein|tara:strand:- start:433 stop:615 length:183 start_codon:yes stop_codon:yes gene_type:complete